MDRLGPASYGTRTGQSDINRLTTAPALPVGWAKVGPGLWKHENGEESRINPSSLTTNTNFGALTSQEMDPDHKFTPMHHAGQGRVPGDLGAMNEGPPTSHPPPPPPKGHVGAYQHVPASQPESMMPPVPNALPEGWAAGHDPASGREYYANLTTGETTWVRPVQERQRAATIVGAPAMPPDVSEVSLSDSPDVSARFDVGAAVHVEGLMARPQLNGCRAVVEGFDEAKERYTVRFSEYPDTVLALKAANLKLSETPKPPPLATSAGDSWGEKPKPPPPPLATSAEGSLGSSVPSPPQQHHEVARAAAPGQSSRASSTAVDSVSQSPPVAKPEPAQSSGLPEGWEARHDPASGHTWYQNVRTGEATWTCPGTATNDRAPDGGEGNNAAGHAVGGDPGGQNAEEVTREAVMSLRSLCKELEVIHDDACSEELQDRGGGEHGAAQARFALDAAQKVLAQWEAKMGA